MKSDYYTLDNGKQAIYYIYEHGLGFSYGNAFKYLVRAGRKENNSADSDLNKALVYIMSSDKEMTLAKRLAKRTYNKLKFNIKTQFAEHHLAEILKSIILFDDPIKIARMIVQYMKFRGIEVNDRFKLFE